MDLEQARAIIPDEENSALQVLKVDRLIPKNWWDEEKEPSQSLELIKEALLAARKLATYHNGRYPFKPTKSLLAYSLTESADRVFYVLDWGYNRKLLMVE